MLGPASICWANLTPFSLKWGDIKLGQLDRLMAEARALAARHGGRGRHCHFVKK
jgi:hypothetical protein